MEREAGMENRCGLLCIVLKCHFQVALPQQVTSAKSLKKSNKVKKISCGREWRKHKIK